MSSWWHRDVIAAAKLPLMLCFLAFVVTFVTTRAITRMIRDGRGPFRNVTADGTHIHHSVPGIILLIIGAFTAIGGPDSLGWRSFAAVAVGTGTSLVLDEFALILHLQDVYWSGEGQLSVEAVSLTAACLGLALAGFSPFGIKDADSIEISLRLTATGVLAADGVLALICVLKGKYRTALFGLFLPPVAIFGALRLARPASIWALPGCDQPTGTATVDGTTKLRRAKMIGDLFDSPWKVLIVAVVLIVLFGSKKLPDAARSLGKSMRILKTEVGSLHDDEPAAMDKGPS